MAGRRAFRAIPAACFLVLVGLAANAQEPVFVTSEQCIACHSNMVDAQGHPVSIGYAWRASMMALSAKDPYWMAGVRREIADRPHLRSEIEDTCSVCHMPMFRTTAVANGGSGEILRYLEGGFDAAELRIAEDGVSCTVCHQISPENFGDHGSFGGGYVITPSTPENGQMFGPYEIDAGLQALMHSAAAVRPESGTHVQQSELCATCHTLFTPAVDGSGNSIGEFPEQVPYLEWRNSNYAQSQSCQNCHMPEVTTTAQISSVLGQQRENVSQHVFRGGNVFMLRLLEKYRDELKVTTPSNEMQASAESTLDHLQNNSASVDVVSIKVNGLTADVDVAVRNLAGHKLPTAYPSRRAWLHLRVTDMATGDLVFESGALKPDGSITGNDNDTDASRFEPHYDLIESADEVQIYEPIVVNYAGEVTTSLLSAAGYAKDNRLLPEGFDKSGAEQAVAVRGAAADDENFAAGEDHVRYRFAVSEPGQSLQVTVRLIYQTIGFRWASNLRNYDTFETNRFVRYFGDNAGISAVVLAEASGE